jgi:4a-hydroxytetrahydrobiopterin dehydratase
MADLTREKCVACNRLSPKVTGGELAILKPQIPGWDIAEIDGVSRLVRVFKFPDFAQALNFTNRVGALAEEEGHHPALLTEWGKVTVSWWTHAIGGLHRNDFIMASRTGQLYQ